LVVSAAHRVIDISEHIAELRYGREFARPPFLLDVPHYVASRLEDEASRAALQAGDEITRINGQRVNYAATDFWGALRARRAGDRLAVEATRGGAAQPSSVSASIVLQPIRTEEPSAVEVTQFALNNVLTPLVCTALGFWVVAVRIRDVRAWLLLFLLLGVVEFATGNPRSLFGRQDFFQPIAAAYQPLLANLLATVLLLFAIAFPERLDFDRRAPWAKWLLIAIGDISGKGIPAALLMATLRAFLRARRSAAKEILPR
jgi:sigma-B regulation protein RsbU (phosphoserine phosphatase)